MLFANFFYKIIEPILRQNEKIETLIKSHLEGAEVVIKKHRQETHLLKSELLEIQKKESLLLDKIQSIENSLCEINKELFSTKNNQSVIERRLDELFFLVNEKAFSIDERTRWLSQAFLDKGGLSLLKLYFVTLGVNKKYEKFFLTIKSGDTVIDGGANLGIFSDMALSLGAKVYTFEPNPILFHFLKKKYEKRGSNEILLYDCAISSEDKVTSISIGVDDNCSYIDASQGGSISQDNQFIKKCDYSVDYLVSCIDFCKFLSQVYKETGKKIKLVKLDIEGEEFEVIDRIIESKSYELFELLVCETHQRYFTDGEVKLRELKEKLVQHNITNIDLDWA